MFKCIRDRIFKSQKNDGDLYRICPGQIVPMAVEIPTPPSHLVRQDGEPCNDLYLRAPNKPKSELQLYAESLNQDTHTVFDAIEAGDLVHLSVCIARGDDVNQIHPQNDLIDPLMLTIHGEVNVPIQTRNAMTRMLLYAGALLLGDYRETCTVAILFYSPCEVLERLFKDDDSMDDLDSYGSTMLHAAVWANAVHLIRFLVACGHNPSFQDSQQQSVYHYAVTLGKFDLIPHLGNSESLFGHLETIWDGMTLRNRLEETVAGRCVLSQCLEDNGRINDLWTMLGKVRQNDAPRKHKNLGDFECPVCFEHHTKATVGGCGHRVCCGCWSKITASNCAPCPTCRSPLDRNQSIVVFS